MSSNIPSNVLDYSDRFDPKLGRGDAIFDIFFISLASAYVLSFVEACQLNLSEGAVGGSAYIASAPCNVGWQSAHPALAAFILHLPVPPIGLALLLLWMVTSYTVPILAAAILAGRVYTRWRQVRWWATLLLALLLLLAVLPWIGQAMDVIGD